MKLWIVVATREGKLTGITPFTNEDAAIAWKLRQETGEGIRTTKTEYAIWQRTATDNSRSVA